MAIFSFRPAPGAHRRRSALDAPADWAETRPSAFPDGDPTFVSRSGAFQTDPDPGIESAERIRPPGREQRVVPAQVPPQPGIAAAFGSSSESKPESGFAKALTARAQNDDLLGAGWYISSWDLMQGCDVIEGTPVDQLPPEWQRKRTRA